MKLRCCFPTCKREAEFSIHENRTDIPPDSGETHSCPFHIGDLLGSTKEPHKYEWVVVALHPVVVA